MKKQKYDLAVIGACGHVGLPLSISFANEGLKVMGIDINEDSIKLAKNKQMPFKEEGAQELLEKVVDSKRLRFSNDSSNVSYAKHIIIIPGTAVDENLCTDLSHLEKVVNNLMPNLQDDQTIILRSTLAPRTTDYIRTYIEKKTNFKICKDLYLTFAPERIAEGYAIKELKELPQIVGAYDDVGFENTKKLFSRFTDKIIRTTPLEAELTKLFTNSWRYARFALANEYAIIADSLGANIYTILDAVNYDYPRAKIPKPGLAKGPCLGKDTWLLLNGVPAYGSLNSVIASAYSVNESMPAFMINKAKDHIGDLSGKKIAVLGLTFKRDSDDKRDSLSQKLIRMLKNEFAEIKMHDPFVAQGNIAEIVKDANAVFITVNHSEYDNLDLSKMAQAGTVVVDLWNVTGKSELSYIL